jgi:hypothetical protein
MKLISLNDNFQFFVVFPFFEPINILFILPFECTITSALNTPNEETDEAISLHYIAYK